MSKTQAFRALHGNRGQPLLLPNVWDAGGAKLVESLGAKAVAPTSAGVAWSLAYADGNRLPARRQAQLAEDIVKVVKTPVSIDVEAGYSDDPSTVAENLKAILASGV